MAAYPCGGDPEQEHDGPEWLYVMGALRGIDPPRAPCSSADGLGCGRNSRPCVAEADVMAGGTENRTSIAPYGAEVEEYSPIWRTDHGLR